MWKFVTKKRATDDIVLRLPDPDKAVNKDAADKIKAANAEIVSSLSNDQSTTTTKRGVKRKASNNHYTPEVRAKIAKYAAEHGNVAAARKFSNDLQLDIKESSVRAIKKKYIAQVKETKHQPVTELTPEKRGRPLLLGDLDQDVANHIRSIREAGGIVNQAITIATARGLVKHKTPTLLTELGGPIDITKTWAVSFLKRLGYVKRKGTKAARKLPDDYEHQKSEFLRIIKETITKHNIPPQLIFNFDQTGLKIVPVSNWTLATEGSTQVDIIGLEDKREITALLGSKADGCLLPPQILYQGKTDQCHAKYPFPDDWDIYHTENHWSTEESMVRYVTHKCPGAIHQQNKRRARFADKTAVTSDFRCLPCTQMPRCSRRFIKGPYTARFRTCRLYRGTPTYGSQCKWRTEIKKCHEK